MGEARRQENRAARVGGPQQRIERANEPPIGGDVDRECVVPLVRFDMAEGGYRPQRAGVADENIELAPAREDRRAEPVERVEILDVARHQGRGRSAFRADRIVEVLERALVRARAMTWAPALASSRATARPMPREAPVTRAMRPLREAGMDGLVLGR